MADETTKPKMAVPADEWANSEVHKASTYSCGKCGQRFESPERLYDHLDAEHADE